MERGNKEKIIEMIKAIENKNSEMEEYISNLSILSRNDMLKKITQDIINNNSLYIFVLILTFFQYVETINYIWNFPDNKIYNFVSFLKICCKNFSSFFSPVFN